VVSFLFENGAALRLRTIFSAVAMIDNDESRSKYAVDLIFFTN